MDVLRWVIAILNLSSVITLVSICHCISDKILINNNYNHWGVLIFLVFDWCILPGNRLYNLTTGPGFCVTSPFPSFLSLFLFPIKTAEHLIHFSYGKPVLKGVLQSILILRRSRLSQVAPSSFISLLCSPTRS